jgi:hypothetical protein
MLRWVQTASKALRKRCRTIIPDKELANMIYFASAHGEVSWNDRMQSVVVEWKGFAYGREFQDILMKGTELLALMKGSKVLMDIREGAAIKAEDKAWIGEFFVGYAYESGLRQLAMVQPNSAVARSSVSRTVNGLGELPYRQMSFADLNEAVRWLAQTETETSRELRAIG